MNISVCQFLEINFANGLLLCLVMSTYCLCLPIIGKCLKIEAKTYETLYNNKGTNAKEQNKTYYNDFKIPEWCIIGEYSMIIKFSCTWGDDEHSNRWHK